MKRTGTVIRVEDGMALVSCGGSEACATCQAKHACQFLSGGGDQKAESWMKNSAGAFPGDTVELELSPRASLTIIASTFLLPVLLLAAGYLFMMNQSDTGRAAGAGVGLLVGILISIHINRRLGSRDEFAMKMCGIPVGSDQRQEIEDGSQSDPEGGSQ